MKKQKNKIALSIVMALLLTVLVPIFNVPSRAESLDSLYIGDFINDMILDEARGYIYTTLGEGSRFAFISLDNMQVEKEIPLSSYAYDAKMYNGKLYLALRNENKIVAINLETKEIENTYNTTNKPDNFVIDGNRIFFVTSEQSTYLYEYNLDTGEEKTLIVGNDTYTTYANPDLTIDRENNVLYIGESANSGSTIDAMSTIDYSRLHNSTYDEGYGFPFVYRNVILDGQDIFYAGRKFDKNNLSTIYGMYMSDGIEKYKYNDNIIYVKDNYVITDEYIYDRNTFVRLAKTPYESKRILMDSSNNIYVYNWDTMSLEKKSLDLDLKNDDDYNLGNVLFINNIQLHDWIYDDLNDKIYALSDNCNKLLFINGNDLIIENELNIGSLPSDIEIYDNKIYISLFGGTRIAIVDISTRQIEGHIDLKHNPYKIAIDNNKIFYVEEDQHLYLYEYDLNTGIEKEITVQGDTYTSYYEADLVVDRLNHILYIGESGSSGSDIEAISTIDYLRVDKSNIDFEYPEKNIILDGDDIFYASHKLNKNDLSQIYGKYHDIEFTYDEDIIYVVGDYVFSKNAVYDRNNFTKIANVSSDLVISDKQGKIYIYDDTDNSIFSFNSVEQMTMDYPRSFSAIFNEEGALELSWDAVSGAEGYNIYYEYALEPSRPIKLNNEILTDTVYEEVYLDKWYNNIAWFGATAVIEGKESTISVMDFKFFENAVNTPSNFNIDYNKDTGAVRFNWDVEATADGYNLYYRHSENEDFIRLNTDLITDTIYESVYGSVYAYDWYGNTIDFGLTAIADGEKSSYNIKNFSFLDIEDDTDGNDTDEDDTDEDDTDEDNTDNDNDSNTPSSRPNDSDTVKEDNNINEDDSININDTVTEEKTTEEDGTTSNTVVFDEEKLDEIIKDLEDEEELKLEVEDEADKIVIKLPGQSYHRLNGKGNDKKITFSTSNGIYVLPVNAINVNDYISKSDKSTIEIEIAKINNDEILNSISEDELKLIGYPVEFTVKINDSEKVYEIKSFGEKYVERWIELKEKPEERTTVGIVYDKKTKEYMHVPTKFEKKYGKYWAVLKRNGNSIYAVVKSQKEFSDIDNHWAKEDIELMASKLIAKGMTKSEFAPSEKITRAQYVALLIRALGLTSESRVELSFKDINVNAWYAEAVKTAVEYGFVSGYEDGTFKPNKTISREEMAAITIRALEFVGGKQNSDITKINKFDDADEIDSWAKDSVATAVNLKLIKGKEERKFDPNAYTTRAESIVLLKRLLEKLNFIQE